MDKCEKIAFSDKEKLYNHLNFTLKSLITKEDDWLANLSNAAALLWMYLEDINWAGFYLYKEREGQLVLGPFQGKPACTRINIGSGVCGTAAKEKKTQVVKNVHEFPGHIACDPVSNSEIVVPIIKGDKVVGVLDIDSPLYSRFDEEDARFLESFVEILNQYISWMR